MSDGATIILLVILFSISMNLMSFRNHTKRIADFCERSEARMKHGRSE